MGAGSPEMLGPPGVGISSTTVEVDEVAFYFFPLILSHKFATPLEKNQKFPFVNLFSFSLLHSFEVAATKELLCWSLLSFLTCQLSIFRGTNLLQKVSLDLRINAFRNDSILYIGTH